MGQCQGGSFLLGAWRIQTGVQCRRINNLDYHYYNCCIFLTLALNRAVARSKRRMSFRFDQLSSSSEII